MTSVFRPLTLCVCAILLLVGACSTHQQPAPRATTAAALRFDSIFSDHMVLQRRAPLPVYGVARPNERVVISLIDQTRTVIADDKGKWFCRFDPIDSVSSFSLTASTADGAVTLHDVLAGEVWVCSGQSNMELLVKSCSAATQEVAAAKHPRIRITSSSAAWVKANGRGWVECSPANIANCSAVGYFFGRDLQLQLDVPIGLIVRAVGGTVIKQWAPKSGAAIESDAELRILHDRWMEAAGIYPVAQKTYSAWQATTRATKGTASAIAPFVPVNPKVWGNMYEQQIAPLQPFAIRGVIWYQGETDARTAHEEDQADTLALMIRSWRRAWGQGDFPFLVVQLANDWGGATANKPPPVPAMPPENHHWPWVREAQAAACRLVANADYVCTIDLGGKMHYPGKQEVGRRLALLAERDVYQLPVTASGPEFDSMRVDGKRVRLAFKNCGGGLVIKGGGKVQSFAIAGTDRRFVWAEAKVEGAEVVVWSDQVPSPVAVRYGWMNDPHGNLYCAEGFPTSPFRTDDWARGSQVSGGTRLASEPAK